MNAKPLFPWPGGKTRLAKHILPLINDRPRTCYVEAFAGSAAILFSRAPAKVEVLNDTHGELVRLYRVVANHLDEFVRHFRWSMTSREMYRWAQLQNVDTLTDIQRAARFYYLQKLSFGAKLEGQTLGVGPTSAKRINLLRLEQDLSDAHLRLQGVVVEQLTWQRCIEKYDRAETLFLLDLPYWETTGYGDRQCLANWTKISGYITISNPTVKAQLWATIQGRNGQTPQNVALLIDNVMWQDVTDAYGAKAAADAAATGLSALTTTVTQQGGQISAQATQLNQVQASLSGKAEASVVASMSAAVASIGRGGNLITNSTFPQWQRNGWGWYSNPHGFRELGDPTNDPQWSPTGVSGIGSVVPGVLPNGYDGYFGTEYFIGIDANRTYCVSGYMSNHRCSMALYAEFYDRAGNIVGNISCPYTSSAASAPVTLNNLSRQFAIGKAPANAASARIICRVVGTGENQPYFWLFRPMFSEVGEGATTPPPWSAGGTESSASWQVMMNTDGYVSGLQLTAKGQKSAFNVLASAMNILSPGGADGIEMTNGYLRVWRGNSQRIIGNGFGNGGEGLIDYFGPNVGAVAASKANATVWMDVNGNAYWGGSLAAGVLRKAVQSTQITTVGTQVVNGPFGSNGRNKSVVVGFSREVNRRKNQYSSQGFVAGAGANTCTINVYRKVDNDPETFWTSFTAGGGVGIYNETDGPDIATSYWSGSVTLNDNIDGSRPRQYRAEIVGYSEQAVAHQSGNFDVQATNQSLSIVSIEV